MKRLIVARRLLLFLALAMIATPTYAETSASWFDVEYIQGELCTFLEEAEPGSRLPVEVTGIYGTGFEMAVFYDPTKESCALNVQPSTWVDFAPGNKKTEGFVDLLDRRHFLLVTFRGFLEGPKLVPPDDPSIPIISMMAKQTATRYGHLSTFRTRLLVTEVLQAEPVPKKLYTHPPASHFSPQAQKVPEIVDANLPSYPEAARQAYLEGSVLLEVTVEQGQVISVRWLAGDRLLAQGAIRNVESWQFPPETDWVFRTRFEFELEKRTLAEGPNPTLEMKLPFSVKVIAPSDDW